MSTKNRTGLLVKLGAVVIVAVGVTAIALTDSGDDAAHHLTAQFTDASPLLVGNDVRLGGVKVGEVSSMSVGKGGVADVVVALDDAAYPLHTDASLTIKPVSLLGERYLDLNRGTATAPVLTGGVLSTAHTAQSTDLDEVLNTVDDPTGDSLAALVTMLGRGLDGNGANIASTIKSLAPAVGKVDNLMSVLDQQNDLLQSTLDSIQPVASALAANDGKNLDQLVAVADGVLQTTATNQLALQQSLAELPGTLQTAQQTLANLAGTANAALPTLQGLRPTTDNLSQISSELEAFADAADPALASAKPVLAKADELLKKAYPVVNALQPAGSSLVTDANSLRPLAGQLAGNVDNVLNFIKYWALSTNGYDGLSHYFRAMVVATPLSVTGLVPGLGGNLGVGGSSATTTAKAATPAAKATDPVGGLLNTVGGLVGGLLSPKTGTDGSVTGLDQKQEQGALGSLLGLLGGS